MKKESILEFINRKNDQFKRELVSSKHVSMKDIGRKGRLNFIREKWYFLPASNLPQKKVFVVEKLRMMKPSGKLAYKKYLHEGEVEYRVGYYIIGRIGKARDKWMWGQFCPIISADDFRQLIKQVKRMEID